LVASWIQFQFRVPFSASIIEALTFAFVFIAPRFPLKVPHVRPPLSFHGRRYFLQGREIIPYLSVLDNLKLGMSAGKKFPKSLMKF
jgi:hypothetical protein